MKTETFYLTTEQIIKGAECPFPLSVIPNNMGINLVSVKGIYWEKREDGQLTNLTIDFIPSEE